MTDISHENFPIDFFMIIIYLLKNRKDGIKGFVHFLKLDLRIMYFEIHLNATGHSIKQFFKT